MKRPLRMILFGFVTRVFNRLVELCTELSNYTYLYPICLQCSSRYIDPSFVQFVAFGCTIGVLDKNIHLSAIPSRANCKNHG